MVDSFMTEAELAASIQLHRLGVSASHLARRYGVARTTLYTAWSKAGYDWNGQGSDQRLLEGRRTARRNRYYRERRGCDAP
jgi:hypothetical protein